MLGADTNILIRLIVRDNAAQCLAIETLLETERLFISLSVALEVEWVLRASYHMPRSDIAATLIQFMAVDSLQFEAHTDLLWALDRYTAGADMGDMIHLIVNRDWPAFVTLDRKLAVQAGDAAPIAILTLR